MDTLFSHVSIVTMDDRMSVWTDSFLGVTDGKISYLGKKAPEEQPQTIIDVLHLPRLVMPVATITLGWPAGAAPLSDRLPATAFVHHEHYVQPTPESIDRDYGPREALEENRRFCEINHTETLAQIFTDIRYTREACEAMSQTLLDALRRQGFLAD